MSSLQDPRSARLLTLTSVTDARGMLVAVENGADLPFAINRLFYIVGTNEAPRGSHAHREQHQMLVCASGSCRVLTDDGAERKEWLLDRPNLALYAPPLHWVEMSEFSANCVLVVLASDAYDDADYIHDHDEFLTATGNAAAS